jgi:hypothetical protein
MGVKETPRAATRPLSARLREYEWRKADWQAAHPHANFSEFQRAMRDIARKLKI